jgi:uncharacterized protein YjbI with pentapeptide repeats
MRPASVNHPTALALSVAILMLASGPGLIAVASAMGSHTSQSPASLMAGGPGSTAPASASPTHASPTAFSTASATPSTVGNRADWVGTDPSGTFGSDSLTFSLSGFGSETDNCPSSALPCNGESETNAYELQINTNTFTCNTAFTGGVNAKCWEQFIYSNCPNLSCLNYQTLGYGGQENIYIEYWLLGYLNSNTNCPSGSLPDGGETWNTNGNSCVADTTHLTATGEPPSNLGNLDLTASVIGGSDTVTLTDSSTDNSWSWPETDGILDLSAHWNQSEANVFGDGNDGQAQFNSGTSIGITSSFTPGSGQSSFLPTCLFGNGTTGETNNLSAGPCTTSTDVLSFTETNGPVPTTTSTQVYDASSGAPWSGSEVTGASAYDTATVGAGPGPTPTGSVTYDFWTNSGCSGPSTPQVVGLTGGSVPSSNPTGSLAPGSYGFEASYGGDSNNLPSTSPCEAFTVATLVVNLPPGLSSSTGIDGSGNTVISLTESGNVVGEVILPPGTTYPGGDVTISYSTSTTGGITNNIIQVSGATVPYPPGKSILILASGNNEVCIVDAPSGASLTYPPNCIYTNPSQYQVLLKCNGVSETYTLPDGVRTYTCNRVTIGGTDYLRVDGLAHSLVETLTKGTPTISSTVTPESMVIGSSATDLATLTGGYAPSGTLTYTVFSDPGCGVQVFDSTAPVGTASATFTPSSLGLYEWIANYSGNVNNYPASTVCGSEPLGVFDFTVSLSPAAESLSQGASTTMTVSVGLVPGSATLALPMVSLTLAGLPAGIIAVGFPSSLAIGSSQIFTLETSSVASYVSCPQVSHSGGQNLKTADLAHCNLAGYDLKGDNLQYANLSDADLQNANLAGDNLQYADLASANTAGADFHGGNLQYTDLSSAFPTGTFTLTATGSADGAARSGTSSLTVYGNQLSGDSFQGDNLQYANFAGDLAIGTNFQGVNLQHADLAGTVVQGADFQGDNLENAVLAGATLTGLGPAPSQLTNFNGANLQYIDLTGAFCGTPNYITATGANLRGASGVPASCNPPLDPPLSPASHPFGAAILLFFSPSAPLGIVLVIEMLLGFVGAVQIVRHRPSSRSPTRSVSRDSERSDPVPPAGSRPGS